MIQRLLLAITISLSAATVYAQPHAQAAIIFDSDMGPDYDDVGAITLLHAFADSGEARILATVASTRYDRVAAVFDVFNTYFNRPDIPVGVPAAPALTLRDNQHWTDSILLHYPHRINSNNDVPTSLDVYRKVLAAQPDHSVTIITVGFLTNLAELLRSKGDRYSKLSGRELVRQKVRQLVCMAGRFPSGSEFNVNRDAAASQLVFNTWETPVLLSGFEIGKEIRTGLPLIRNETIQRSPVKDVFRISIPLAQEDSAGRMSWDETAVLVAVRGTAAWYTTESGQMIVADDGSNTWATEKSAHQRLIADKPPAVVEQLINQLMQHQPVKR